MGILSLILSWFGGGPLGSIIKGLNQAYSDSLNAKTLEEKIAAQERIDHLTLLYADTANARSAAAGYPWWMALLAFMFGVGFACHVLFIGLGTAFQPLIVGGWFAWLLAIPKLPPPYDSTEIGIVGFFYGFSAISVASGAIAGAIAKRK